MKKALAATALAATLLAGSAVTSFAATKSLNGGAAITSTDSFDYSNKFKSPGAAATSFSDIYTFTLGTTATVALAQVGESYAAANAYIRNLTVALFSAGSSTALTSNNASTGAYAAPGTSSASVSYSNLGAGNYFVKITGDLSKSPAAAYSGTLSISAVPLPSTVALFGVALAGLGVAGAMRRKSAASAA